MTIRSLVIARIVMRMDMSATMATTAIAPTGPAAAMLVLTLELGTGTMVTQPLAHRAPARVPARTSCERLGDHRGRHP
jgi:hypothetical protein